LPAKKGYKIRLTAKSRKVGDRVVALVMPQFVSADSELYKVENEFNAVIVEGGIFLSISFFIGKGGGWISYRPLRCFSDISALTYQYKYEYKKDQTGVWLEAEFRL
jgi:homoserine dehydrogenase